MASFPLASVADLFPVGTSVGAYLASGWPATSLPPSGAPVPSATSSATVASSGSLAFTGLADDTRYFAGAQVSGVWRYRGFRTPPVSAGAAVTGIPRVINVADAPYSLTPAATLGAVTDQYTALAQAISDCSALGGGTVFLPGGYWGHSQTLVLPDNVTLTGVAVNSGPTSNAALVGTRLVATGSFPIMSPQVTLGQRLPATVGTTGLVFGGKLANLMLDGNFVAWFGAYTNKAQEHCAISDVSTQRHPFFGLWAATPNGAPGANQTNNFGMDDVKVALGYAAGQTYAYTSLTLVGSAPTVGASSTNPYDSLSNITRPVTTPGESSGVVTVSSTTGLPAQGVFIAAPVTADNPPVVVCYTSIIDGTRLGGCLTDANPSSGTPTPLTAIDTAKNVDFNGAGIYIQNVGAFRGIDNYTLDMGVAGAAAVGMRLDQCNGVFTRGHAESVKYGILLNAAGRCNGVVIQGLMTGDNTLTDLVRISANFSGNSQHGVSFSGIANRVNGAVNTINDLLNGKVVKDGYVAEYSIGDSTYGNAAFGRPIMSATSSVPPRFSKGIVVATKAGVHADGDYNIASDGLVGVDTTNKALMFRAGGTWVTVNPASIGTYYPWSINNLLGWAFDPAINGAGSAVTSGQLMLTKVMITPGSTITNLLSYVTSAGASLTSSQCFGALFDTSGNLLGTSADQSGTWISTGLKTMALTAQSAGSLTVAGAWVYAALLSNGGTPPSFATTAGSTTNALTNAGLVAANGFRGGTILSAQTSMPTSIVPGNVANLGNVRWAGVS